jgi:hypothetical protein
VTWDSATAASFALRDRRPDEAAAIMRLSPDSTLALDETIGNGALAKPVNPIQISAFTYESPWKRWRNKPTTTGIVNCPNFPSVLGVNAYWMGIMQF